MLPFLKPKKIAGLSIAIRKPDGSSEAQDAEGEDSALTACAEDMLRAIASKDAAQLASAMRAAFEVLESEPHEEPEEIESEEEEQE